jgi:microcystin-dependent protein
MSKISLEGNVSGSGTLTISAPNTNSNFTLTLPTESGTIGVNSSPAGTVIFYAANTAPTGFLKANGANVSRTTYAALFAAIGTTFGSGDGSTTFGLPDLRGEFIRGWDDGRGVDSGRVFGSAQSADIAAHSHGIGFDVVGGIGGGVQNFVVKGTSTQFSTNNSTGTETRPRNVALLACIKF